MVTVVTAPILLSPKVAIAMKTDILHTPKSGWKALDPMEKVSVDEMKAKEEFRNYTDSSRHSIVEKHYLMMRQYQTVEYVDRMYAKWHNFDHGKMTIAEAFKKLEGYIDSSDPDADFPNLEHCLQTAEGIRAAGHPEWFQLVGLLHDMGKIMFLWGDDTDGQHGRADSPQWALGGDTWIVGLPIPDTTVFPEFNKESPDLGKFSGLGLYKAKCGLKNVKFAYGHDEYMYRMLVHNKCLIPAEGLAMIRYHSCYPWHDKHEYSVFETNEDRSMKQWVKEFNKFDLYTKGNKRPDVKALWPYYQKLIDKFCPGVLDW